jgi:hypothetical protein
MKFFVPHAEDEAQVMAGRIRCSGSAALSDSKARPWSDEAREAERLKTSMCGFPGVLLATP